MLQSSNKPRISELKQQAIEWLIRLRSDDMSAEELDGFAEWLAQNQAHSEAFSEAENLFDEMTQAATVNEFNPVVQPNSIVTRPQKRSFRWFAPAMALAAVWLLAVLLIIPAQMNLWDILVSDYHTQTGELKEIQLADGSRLLLGTNSAVSVNYDNSSRQILLHYGQVRFSVAEDSRPFDVKTDGITVRALGTVFQVHKKNDIDVTISVQEHAVAVQRAQETGSTQKGNVTVQTGQQMHIQATSALPQPVAVDLDQVSAWTQQRLIINDQPLAELISELERYCNGRIFLADKSLHSLRVTGVFSLTQLRHLMMQFPAISIS